MLYHIESTHLMPMLIDDGGAYKLETYVDLMLSLEEGEDILFHFSDMSHPRNIYTYALLCSLDAAGESDVSNLCCVSCSCCCCSSLDLSLSKYMYDNRNGIYLYGVE